MVTFSAKLHAAAHHLAAERFIDAGRHLSLLLKANFNPSQSRVPAGSANGGRWTDGGGGSSGASGIYTVGDQFRTNNIDLRAIEGYRGAHTLRDHEDISKAELLAKMGPEAGWWPPVQLIVLRQGKFGSEPDATRFVNETITSNPDRVAAVRAGLEGVEEGATIKKFYGYPTGAEWYRASADAKPQWRTTYGVAVILRYDPRLPQGFLVVTAFPINVDLEAKTMREHAINSPGFRVFTRAMHQDILVLEPRERLIDACLGSVFARGPDMVADLEGFLVRWLVPSVSDKQLADLWAAGEADFFVNEHYIREFLTETLQKLRDRRDS